MRRDPGSTAAPRRENTVAAADGGTAAADGDGAVRAPAIAAPKGGGAIRGIGEKFSVNPVTGTASLSIPLPVSPGRAGFGPQLSLDYDSGNGNGAFGLGWSLSLPAITRKTDKGLPRYHDDVESDVFILAGAEDLVPVLTGAGERWVADRTDADGNTFTVHRYRPRTEGLFARIERWRRDDTGEVHWRSISRENVTTIYGRTAAARIADPADPSRVYSWLIEEATSDRGEIIAYEYATENGDGVDPTLPHECARIARGDAFANRYLTCVRYANRTPGVRGDWLFSLALDYATPGANDPEACNARPWPARTDAFSSYRAGFEVRTWRLCRRALVFHHFPTPALPRSPYLVRALELEYEETPVAAYLTRVTQRGYRWDDAAGRYVDRALPPLELSYGSRVLHEEVRTVAREALEGLPAGLADTRQQWVDLDSEGIAGALSVGAGWYYTRNLGTVPPRAVDDPADPPAIATSAAPLRFAPPELLPAQPAGGDLPGGRAQLIDIAGEGRKSLVQFAPPLAGYVPRTADGGWESFVPFAAVPNLEWRSTRPQLVDLTGDGLPDLVVEDEGSLAWHASLGKRGFAPRVRVALGADEEDGPLTVHGDERQAILFADVSGDGLTDIVRVRNGEVCYWPNLGYGRFGPKVVMAGAPRFDHDDLFDPGRVRLADIDGSGTDDLVYVGRDGVAIHFNQGGNSWSAARHLRGLPSTDDAATVSVLDLLGQGTACLVWSSPLPAHADAPLRYVDLLGGRKPHLLESIRNGMGAETRLQYAPSTKFYLEDRAAGRPWTTRLSFPVHVVERRETRDAITGAKLVTLSRYRDGYFDPFEREFRGFGCVEQWDTESFHAYRGPGLFAQPAPAADEESHLPPVYTRTWFHTGAWLDGEDLSRHYAAHEYYAGDAAAWQLPDTVLPQGLTLDEQREAVRALRGQVLRQEVYSRDGSARQDHPYTVTERSHAVRRLQARAGNRHAVFLVQPAQSLACHYERDPADPRIAHDLVLEVDDHGIVTKSASVAYPRRVPAYAEQGRMLATCSHVELTPPLDTSDAWRTPLTWRTRTFELTGVAAPPGAPLSLERVRQWLDDATPVGYETAPTSGIPVKRLLGEARARFLSDDLTGPLPFGQAESRALAWESYRLALPDALVTQVYAGRVSAQVLAGEGGYVQLAGSPDWWVPSGRAVYASDAAAHFYLPSGVRDPFGAVTAVTHDAYDLLVTDTRDPHGNAMRAANDYRVLQPHLVTDANGNRTTVAFDALGRVAGMALLSQAGRGEGDDLTGFEPDPDEATVIAYGSDPLATGATLLARATKCFVYDPWRFARTGHEPALIASLAREVHESDLASGQQSPIQHLLVYSDGLGREVQRKTRAEPGDAPLRDPATGALLDANGQLVIGHASPRWAGSGRAVYDNKGNPVRKYEPFFSSTHRYEHETELVEWGVTPVLRYDPLGRVVRVDHPDGTLMRIEFDSWRRRTWDPNDTVKESAWLGRVLPGYDPAHPPAAPTPEQTAAIRALGHAETPLVEHLDVLTRVFLAIADNGAAGKYATHSTLDIEGHPVAVTDALGRVAVRQVFAPGGAGLYSSSIDAGERWMLTDATGSLIRLWDVRQHAVRMAYDALRRPTHRFASAAGGAEVLLDRTLYGDTPGLGLGSQQLDTGNLRGRVYRQYDGAGALTSEAYDFKGNLLRASRRLASDYTVTPDWSPLASVTDAHAAATAAGPLLDQEAFTSEGRFDALDRPIRSLTPSNAAIPASELRPTFNDAGLVERVDVRLRGAAAWTTFIANVDYDARGRRTRLERRITDTGGTSATVRTDYQYDPLSARLVSIKTTRSTDGTVLQDLSYVHDPVGNISYVADAAQQTMFFRNRRVDPDADFEYDALYRLVTARGREHLGLVLGGTGSPRQPDRDDSFWSAQLHPGDGNALGRYVERYDYDAVGNILGMRHADASAPASGWTRVYEYEADPATPNVPRSNRLVGTSPPGASETAPVTYGMDAHGNMTSMPGLAQLVWDVDDRLVRADLGGGGSAFFVYDAAGQRARKVHAHQGNLVEDRIYFGGFEIYRRRRGGALELERETLHVMDGERRLAIVDTRTDGQVVQLTRYQLDNHLGSATLELDAGGGIISYEEYFPYGATSYRAGRTLVEAELKRYRYTGKERDEETGLYYHGARYYAAWLGRWTSADPAGLVDGPNLFAYCRGNPVGARDSTGRNTQVAGTVGEFNLWDFFEQRSDRYTVFWDWSKSVNDAGFDIPVFDHERQELLFLDNKAFRGRVSDVSAFRSHRVAPNTAMARNAIEAYGGASAEAALNALDRGQVRFVVANFYSGDQQTFANRIFQQGFSVLDVQTGHVSTSMGEFNRARALVARGVELSGGAPGTRVRVGSTGRWMTLAKGVAVAGVALGSASALAEPLMAADQIDELSGEMGSLLTLGSNRFATQTEIDNPHLKRMDGGAFMINPKTGDLYRMITDPGEAFDRKSKLGGLVYVDTLARGNADYFYSPLYKNEDEQTHVYRDVDEKWHMRVSETPGFFDEIAEDIRVWWHDL